MQNPPDLPKLLNDAVFHRLSVVRVSSGWQANLQHTADDYSSRVEHGATPAEAIAACFAPVPVWVPPCPVALP